MALFKKLKSLFKDARYQINRDILRSYVQEQIEFAQSEKLSFCDEFYLLPYESSPEKTHVCILNYDVKDEQTLDSEKDLTGIVIFVNYQKSYDPLHDQRYDSIDALIDSQLRLFPPQFILINDLGEPVSLKPYKMA